MSLQHDKRENQGNKRTSELPESPILPEGLNESVNEFFEIYDSANDFRKEMFKLLEHAISSREFVQLSENERANLGLAYRQIIELVGQIEFYYLKTKS